MIILQLLDLMKIIYALGEDQEVAKLLKREKSTVSKWRTAGKIPAQAEKEIRSLLEVKMGKSLNFNDLDGIAESFRRGGGGFTLIDEPELTLHQKTLLNLFDVADEETQDKVLVMLIKKSRKTGKENP
jgi:hypothetical protein